MLWLEPNGEVHWKLFYSANIMKEFFQNGGEAGWPINTLCFQLVKEGITSLKFLVEVSKGEGICIKWWDQQLYDNTHLISQNKYLEYYFLLIKKELNDN